MSMISGLIDSLRIHADLYEGKTQPPMNHELQRPSLAQELRDAADTIWQLRDDLQRANAAVQDAEHDESMAWDRVRKAEAENDRLRELLTDGERHLLEILGKNKRLQELVRDYESCTMHADCGRCEYDGTTSTHCPLSPCFPDIDELRELGVELE